MSIARQIRILITGVLTVMFIVQPHVTVVIQQVAAAIKINANELKRDYKIE